MNGRDKTGTAAELSEGKHSPMRYGIAVAVVGFVAFCVTVPEFMIRRPTVLILGAGASVPYGFPTGEKLTERILRQTREQNAETRVAMRLAGANDQEIDNLREALSATQFPSIDTFLEHRRQFRDVGKLAIAAALIPCEDKKSLNPKVDKAHWYKQLFTSLIDRHGFSGHKLTVITLNYDRSLEQYLYDTVQRDFELTPQETERKVREVTFIHLHGSLGRLPWWSESQNAPSRVPHDYLPELKPEALKAAAKGISIVSDWDSARNVEFARWIHDKISEAEVVGFLGFGYHEAVMQRLDIAKVLAARKKKAELFACAYQLPNGRRQSLEREFQTTGICVGKPEHGSFEFLNDCALLFQ